MNLSEGTALGALAVTVLNGILLVVRTRGQDSKTAGVDAQRLTAMESRVTKVESDLTDVARSLADIRVALAAIPEQLRGQKELSSVKFEGIEHGIKNLRMSMEALAKVRN